MSADQRAAEDVQTTRQRPPRRSLSALTVLGLVLLLAGLSAVGYMAYQYFGTNVVSQKSFSSEKNNLRKLWQQDQHKPGPGKPVADADQVSRAIPGTAVALLRVPSWGADFEVPILKGISQDTLAKGVGIYGSSVPPGQVGNFAIAGHRITHGQPFSRLLDLKKGDQIVVETRTAIFTYVLDNAPSDLTVKDDAGWVLDPVPGHPGLKPTKALITLTTCQDLFHSPDRSVGFGHLESTVHKK